MYLPIVTDTPTVIQPSRNLNTPTDDDNNYLSILLKKKERIKGIEIVKISIA